VSNIFVGLFFAGFFLHYFYHPEPVLINV